MLRPRGRIWSREGLFASISSWSLDCTNLVCRVFQIEDNDKIQVHISNARFERRMILAWANLVSLIRASENGRQCSVSAWFLVRLRRSRNTFSLSGTVLSCALKTWLKESVLQKTLWCGKITIIIAATAIVLLILSMCIIMVLCRLLSRLEIGNQNSVIFDSSFSPI